MTNDYSYRGYVSTLSSRIEAALESIETGNNLEYGPEFEIVLCETLASALPDRFGVCRGYVVSKRRYSEGNDSAGDDIIIFDRGRFPTLAMRRRNDFARKEFVPIEAAYAYIEAKHTLHLAGDDRQSLSHACRQVQHVKKRVANRPAVPPTQLAPYLNVGGIRSLTPDDFPDIMNPFFGVVFARQVKDKQKGRLLEDGKEILDAIKGQEIPIPDGPDLVVLGKNSLVLSVLPPLEQGGKSRVRSPFFIPNRSDYYPATVNGNAYGICLIQLMAALDWIQLGVLPWHKLVVDALDIPYE